VSLKARLAALEARASEAQGPPIAQQARKALLAALRGEAPAPSPNLSDADRELVLLLVSGLDAVPTIQMEQLRARASRT
jgi:hypothetical protein